MYVIDSMGGQAESYADRDVAPTLKATHYKAPPPRSYVLCINQQGGQMPMITENITATLTAGLNSGNNSVSILEVWDD